MNTRELQAYIYGFSYIVFRSITLRAMMKRARKLKHDPLLVNRGVKGENFYCKRCGKFYFTCDIELNRVNGETDIAHELFTETCENF